MKQKRLRPPVKTHGGKFYLAPWLIEFFPKDFENMTYVEAFIGGGSLLLNKPKSATEVINDLDDNIISVWWALKYHCDSFVESLRELDYTEETFNRAKASQAEYADTDCTLEKALDEYILRRMSRGGMKKAFAWSKRLRGGKPGDLNAWETMLDKLPEIADRVKDVRLHNEDWSEILSDYNDSNVFLYLDPPYVKSTRYKGATNVYAHEMTDRDHIGMLDACLASKSKIMISGYQSPLYAQKLKDWRFKYRPIANHSSQSDRKVVKLECIWLNY